jgi:hypothetical protein
VVTYIPNITVSMVMNMPMGYKYFAKSRSGVKDFNNPNIANGQIVSARIYGRTRLHPIHPPSVKVEESSIYANAQVKEMPTSSMPKDQINARLRLNIKISTEISYSRYT